MIRIEHLHIHLPGFSVQDVDLFVEDGEFFAILGPTGAGKTLILEAIAGLVPISGGQIFLDQAEVTRLPPEARRVGIVYQDYALFPHLTVAENIHFGLRYCKDRKPIQPEDIDNIIKRLGLAHLASRKIDNLSGGERQRVALARALVVRPSVLLLDEPLSSLDPSFREDIRMALKELHTETGVTFLMVTHDFAEALFLAERAALINRGRIEQIGHTIELFQKPASPFAAGFVGMKNVFPAEFSRHRAVLGSLTLELPGPVPSSRQYVAVRPEDIQVGVDRPPAGKNVFPGRLVGLSNNGLHYNLFIQVDHLVFQVLVMKGFLLETPLAEGRDAWIAIRSSDIHTL
jgi:molybdate/tungstate transport system ATP-binding protein